MKTNILSALIAFFIVASVFSQENLNEYKYIIVPKQFSFLKHPDEYRMNGLAKFLFEKYGYSAFMEGDQYPEGYFNNRCSALRVDVFKEPGMFKTRLKAVLKDCNDKVVYTSKTGESREKEFGKAYNESLRDAFLSFKALNYKYTPKKGQTTTVVKQPSVVAKNEEISNNEIQKLKEEIETLKKQKQEEAKQVVAPKAQVVQTVTKEVVVAKPVVSKSMSGVLYAQETENGFQLVDSSPKVVYKIQHTGLSNVYLIEGKNAIIYKKGDSWVAEYYEGKTLKQEALNIKF
ncbi:hypothetical protein GCM10022291_29230 [Postechiella marina]|uniref:Uncharacterized protein n=1 Tax=Postechiella marina TaxID=943941 RepID=A0ABP8CF40_9FLAO